jgi:transcriptional regulator NrdR family protein
MKGNYMNDGEDTKPGDSSGGRERRHYFRFLPNVTTGELMQMVALLVVAFSAYGTYQQDRAEQRIEVATVKRDVEANRQIVQGAINTIQADLKDVQRTLGDVNSNIAVLKSRSEQQRRP